MFPNYERKVELLGMEVLYWNTQREYSINGQKLIAVKVEKDFIYFIDITRDIDGIMESDIFDSTAVMELYDKNQYREVKTGNEYVIKRNILNNIQLFENLF